MNIPSSVKSEQGQLSKIIRVFKRLRWIIVFFFFFRVFIYVRPRERALSRDRIFNCSFNICFCVHIWQYCELTARLLAKKKKKKKISTLEATRILYASFIRARWRIISYVENYCTWHIILYRNNGFLQWQTLRWRYRNGRRNFRPRRHYLVKS